MHLLFLNQWNSEGVLKAICWTFIHSLWLGIAAALFGGIVISTTKKVRPVIRYNILLLLFTCFLFVVTVIFTREFSYFLSKETFSSTVFQKGQVLILGDQLLFNENQGQQNFIANVTVFCNKYASLIVFIWFVFFIAHCVKLCFGVHYMQRLRKSAIPPSTEWKALVKTLSDRIGVHHSIVLKESSLVNVPLTFGFLKATILVPLGLLASLPLDQVEAVLLHELAHIRRKDYLVNLFQSFLETIFFFNPGLLWLSSLIRQEREACCDDLVLQYMPGKQSYLEALVSFQEYSLVHSASVVALTYRKTHLLQRIKRMLTKENEKLNSMEKTLLVIGIIAITAFGFTKAKAPVKNQSVAVPANTAKPSVINGEKRIQPLISTSLPQSKRKIRKPLLAAVAKNDTVPLNSKNDKKQKEGFSNVSTNTNDDGKTKTYEIQATGNDGKKYNVKKVNDAVTEFLIDGKTVDPSQPEYAEVLDQFGRLEADRRVLAKQHQQRLKEHQDRLAAHREKLKELKAEKHLFAKQREHFDKEQRMRKEEWQTQEKLRMAERRMNQEEWQKQQKLKRSEQEKINLLMKMNQEQELKSKKVQTLQKQELLKQQSKLAINKKMLNASNGEINAIINDLTQNKLVTNPDVLSFSLNNNELIVDGKKQPADLHRSLKQKYIQKPGDRFNYSKNGGSTSITINKD